MRGRLRKMAKIAKIKPKLHTCKIETPRKLAEAMRPLFGTEPFTTKQAEAAVKAAKKCKGKPYTSFDGVSDGCGYFTVHAWANFKDGVTVQVVWSWKRVADDVEAWDPASLQVKHALWLNQTGFEDIEPAVAWCGSPAAGGRHVIAGIGEQLSDLDWDLLEDEGAIKLVRHLHRGDVYQIVLTKED